MTFETTMEFMLNACLTKEVDTAQSASAKIILGQVPKCGTGMFSVLQDITKK
jgi:hypothetical protein